MNKDKYTYYPNTDDEEFQSKIYKKREFYASRIKKMKKMKTYEDVKNYRYNECENYNKLRPQQTFLANFIHPDTPYRGLLIFHGVGTGKTACAISIAENFKDMVIKYNTKIHILVPGPLIIDHWYNDIIKFTGDKYLVDIKDKHNLEIMNLNDKEKINSITLNIIKQYYKIISHSSFTRSVIGQRIIEKVVVDQTLAKSYKKTADGEYDREYGLNKITSLDNTILIVDEAHYLNGEEFSLALSKIIKNSRNLRLILLSATPMMNSAEEIVHLLNYLRPLNSQIKKEKIFTNQPILHKMEIINGGLEYLKKMANGYMSYYRGANPLLFAERVDVGEIPDGLMFTKLIRCYMGDFQLKTYRMVKIEIEDTLDRTLGAVSNIVFPILDNNKELIGTYSVGGLEKLIKLLKSSNKNVLLNLINEKLLNKKYEKDDQSILYYDEQFKVLRGEIFKIHNLNIFSSKFVKLFNNLHLLYDRPEDDKYRGAKTAFIFSNLVKVGIELVKSVMIENGYLEFDENNKYNISDNTIDYLTGYSYKECGNKNLTFSPATFFVVTGTIENDENPTDEKKIIIDNIFNNNNNVNGKHIKFIFGSKIMSEGTTLKNVGEVHILDAHYTLNRIYQAMGRALRQCMHYSITNEQNSYPKVHVYRYVASISNDELSAEETMYQKAEKKYVIVKKVERALKEVAIDCPILYNGNVFPNEIEKYKQCKPPSLNRSENHCPEQCDFQICEYKCDDKILNTKYYDPSSGIYKKLSKKGLDYSTFNKNLARDEINYVKKIIKYMFKINIAYTLSDILFFVEIKYMKKELFDKFFVYKALDEFIPVTENDFLNYSDIIIDQYGNNGYLIYKNKYYVFQSFETNEDASMLNRNKFIGVINYDINLHHYLQINGLIQAPVSSHNIKMLIDDTNLYYSKKPEFEIMGYIDIVNDVEIFKMKFSQNKSKSDKKRGTGIQTEQGINCLSMSKNKIDKIMEMLKIKINGTKKDKCSFIKETLLYLEKYSTVKDDNKYVYCYIPKYITSYPFPYNLEDRVNVLIGNLEKIAEKYKLNLKFNVKFEKNKYTISTSNINNEEFIQILKKNNFQLSSKLNYILIIE